MPRDAPFINVESGGPLRYQPALRKVDEFVLAGKSTAGQAVSLRRRVDWASVVEALEYARGEAAYLTLR
jgi:hypothetical protein